MRYTQIPYDIIQITMKISVIIPVLNGATTIRDTMDSIFAQTYSDFECIVVDGGSTDTTLAILEEYQKEDSRIHILNAPKVGIYSSINEGIKSASGEIVNILNSDDFYDDSAVFQNIIHAFEKDNADACYGDMIIIKKNDPSKIVKYWKAGIFNLKHVRSGWTPPHQTLFIKKEIYDQLGFYKDSFKIAGDYEFMLRVLLTEDITLSYIPKILVRMRTGGVSTLSTKNRLLKWKEQRLSWKLNRMKVPFLFITRRILSNIHQYF